MKKLLGILALLLVTGCYTTRVSGAGLSLDTFPESQVHTDRQWFALGGLANLSHSAGGECRHGVAVADSELAGTDILINVGLGLLGGAATYAACGSQDSATRWSCFSAGASFVPWLLGSRTVHYVCADSGVPEVPAVPLVPVPSPSAPAPSDG